MKIIIKKDEDNSGINGLDFPTSTGENNGGDIPGGVNEHSAAMDGETLLKAVWQTPGLVHFVGELDRKNKKFKNTPVSNAVAAYVQALALSDAGKDAYFAPAEYSTPASRTAASAIGSNAFWLDVDCGELLAAEGKGYLIVDDALLAVRQFCLNAGLPQPTYIVATGGGIHVYWVFDEVVLREIWQAFANRLKELTTAFGLLADPCRTSDIASVMRVPGTLNFKYNPPRPVVLLVASAEPLTRSEMLGCIDASYAARCPATTTPGSQHLATSGATSSDDTPSLLELDIARLTSALKVLTPDCTEFTWKMHRLNPLAWAARQYPEQAEALKNLAQDWSSGDLGGVPSKAWNTPGSNGMTGKQCFESVWQRFLKSTYSGKQVTLGTIYFHAKEVGWVFQADEAPVAVNDQAAA